MNLGDPTPELLEFGVPAGECPKCGIPSPSMSDRMLAYRYDYDECRCSPLRGEEHLEIMCFGCGYIRAMKPKDWKSPPDE